MFKVFLGDGIIVVEDIVFYRKDWERDESLRECY